MTGRLMIEDVSPTVDCGRYPAKAVVAETVPVSAVAFGEGTIAIGCQVVWSGPDGQPRPVVRMHPGDPGTDRWQAAIRPDAVGEWRFTIEAFHDPYRQWCDTVAKKHEAGQDTAELANDLAEGALLLDRAAGQVPRLSQGWVRSAAAGLRDPGRPLPARLSGAYDLADLLWRYPVRELVTRSAQRSLWVERQRALFSAWYEFFPRSEGAQVDAAGRPLRHGTFADAAEALPRIAAMGFDVVYLPPIHPIGRTARKGRDNALVAEPSDVGSPWAIGSHEGGHDAIHPQLGSLADFRAFVAQARRHGMEVALDLALQCAPDHPWVTEHPQWFTTRPDGTIAYAENPPKKYEDIYPLNFDNDPAGIRAEVLRVVRHWLAQGVRIFRVDNPHTKPIDFWHWLIGEVRRTDPDVLFLSEAFTRPAVMHGLAKIGFSQSYTYFTWRTTAAQLRDYCRELVAAADHFRPNFWPNTPDILPVQLRHGGPAMFRIRAVLASMLSPAWGIYSGYELAEHAVRPGSDEYLHNEKYQLRPRDWAAAEADGDSLAPFLGKLNRIRREHPALRWLRTLHFHDSDNEAVLCWSKRDPDSGAAVVVVCLLDPEHPHWANLSLDLPALGLSGPQRFTARDLIDGEAYDWSAHNAVRLDPHSRPAHILAIEPDRPGSGLASEV